jgi:hypothetical protein
MNPVPPYGVAIQEAILKGNLPEMKKLAHDVEEYLAKAGDVRSLLEQLKLEIAKAEKKPFSTRP